MTRVIPADDVARERRLYTRPMDRFAALTRWRPPAADVLLALVLVVAGMAEVWTLTEVNRLLGTLEILAVTLPVAWRRVAPSSAAALSVCAVAVAAVLGVAVDSVIAVIPALVIALYSLGAYAIDRRSYVGLGVAVVAVWVATFAESGPGVENLVFGLVVAVSPWLAGRLVRRRTEQAVALALHAQDLERSQQEREQEARTEERHRIARELHDIIAHAVSVMTIQAGAIEEVLDRDPAAARKAAGAIRHTGRTTLSDLRRMLGVIRDGSGELPSTPLRPQPDLSDLHTLAAQVRQAGLAVDLHLDDVPERLDRGVALSAYRVVQESLTNTLKHAGATRAEVYVRVLDGALDVMVIDDGRGTVPESGDTGQGLVGMRERAALFGGAVEAGRRANGGFRVHASLPLKVEPA